VFISVLSSSKKKRKEEKEKERKRSTEYMDKTSIQREQLIHWLE